MDPAAERLALEQLHHENAPALVDADVVDRADVRMIERRRDPRFALEAVGDVGRQLDALRQQLQRDVTAEARVDGLVDDAHSAGAELPDDAVVENLITDHDCSHYRVRGLGLGPCAMGLTQIVFVRNAITDVKRVPSTSTTICGR